MKNLKLYESRRGLGSEVPFKGTIANSFVETTKIEHGTKMRAVVIADLHGYTNDLGKAKRLAETIKMQNPDFIFIAGDLFNGGAPWEGGEKLASLRKFVDILSEAAPVFITWGNHDLRKMTPENKDLRIKNLRDLENVRSGQVFPLYNDRVVINGMEIIGYVPSFELMEGSKLEGLPIQIHGIAHDKFIKEYEEKGVKFEHPELVTTYLGHDPHLIAASENGIGLGNLKVCDFFVTGHLHDGYKPVLEAMGLGNLESLKLDNGWVEQPTLVDRNGKKLRKPLWPPFFGKTNLCRGIVYFDNDAQQSILQTPDGKFYKNVATGANRQIWAPVLEEEARKVVLDQKLHFMLISEGIAPGFAPKEELTTINVVDIKGAQKVLKR